MIKNPETGVLYAEDDYDWPEDEECESCGHPDDICQCPVVVSI